MVGVNKEDVMPEGRITEDALAKLRNLVGTKLRIPQQFNGLASKEAIRNFAYGIGDSNPLWLDDEYCKETKYGSIIAPPSWLYSVFPTWVSVGLPGVHGFHAGNDWEFYKPVRLGDTIKPECEFLGYDEKPTSKFSGKTVILREEARYYNQNKELVARAKTWSVRAERRAARETGKYSKIQLPHPWTEEELRKIEDQVLNEEPRGPRTLYWEDVHVGEEIAPVTKGPLGLTDMISYCVGAPPVLLIAHGMALRMYRKHPAWAFRDPATLALEPIYAVHYNKAAANAAGLPYPYDVGTQRQCWLIHLLTNWMGDEGWLKKNYAEYRRFVYLSDVVWFTGKVTRKFVDEDDEHCVEIETSGINQRGENTIPGHSIVVLPSREKSTWPVERRLK